MAASDFGTNTFTFPRKKGKRCTHIHVRHCCNDWSSVTAHAVLFLQESATACNAKSITNFGNRTTVLKSEDQIHSCKQIGNISEHTLPHDACVTLTKTLCTFLSTHRKESHKTSSFRLDLFSVCCCCTVSH